MNHVVSPCFFLPAELVGMHQLRPFFGSACKHTKALVCIIRPAKWEWLRDEIPIIPAVGKYGTPQDWIFTMAMGNTSRFAEDDIVFACDCRDLIFQSDIFALAQRQKWDMDKVHVFAESSLVTCGTQATNVGWLGRLYPMGIPTIISKRPVVCFGTHFGKWCHLREHFRRVVRWMDLLENYHGLDQAVGTSLAYMNPDLYEVHLNEEEAVMHCVLQWPIIQHNRFVNPHGLIPAVVHQYDRWPHATELVDSLYGAGCRTIEGT